MQPEELVKLLYAEHSRGNVDAALAHCSDDMQFIWMATPEDTPHAGRFGGKAAFERQLRALHEMFEYGELVPVDLVVAGDRVAARTEIHLARRTTGKAFVVPAADFWTIRDGKVVELIEFYDTALVARMI